jgi:DNA mismatch endonuclease (patch repair protein)
MADNLAPEQRSWNMSRIRGKDTGPEMHLRSLLHRAGFRYRLHQPSLPGKPDLVLPRYRTVIFVHGCYWHRHSGCRNATTPSTRKEFWLAKFRATVKRDARALENLTIQGWRVMTVWECELECDPRAVVRRIHRQLAVPS